MSEEEPIKCTFPERIPKIELVVKLAGIGNPHLVRNRISVDWLAVIDYFDAQASKDKALAVVKAKIEELELVPERGWTTGCGTYHRKERLAELKLERKNLLKAPKSGELESRKKLLGDA